MSEVLANLDDFINSLSSRVEACVQEICMDIRNNAVQNCPVDTGLLRASISYQTESLATKIEGVVFSSFEYAIYVHQGTGLYAVDGHGRQQVPWVYRTPDGKYHSTKGQKPNPFLQDAVDEVRPNILSYFERVLT